MIYSLSRILSQRSYSTLPFLLTLLAVCLSTAPIPGLGETGYSLVLVALSVHILQLHLYYPPTPILLFFPERTLPLATLLWHGVSQIFIPATLFFLPALLLTMFLLSLSLSDVVGLILPLAVEPSPLEARSAFVALFTLLFGLLICSLVMLVLIYPSLSSKPRSASGWDRYSDAIGLTARRAFAKAIVTYSSPYLFIAPFNLLQLLFIRIPAAVFVLTQAKGLRHRLRAVERVLWRISVGMLSCVVAGLWLWNILGNF